MILTIDIGNTNIKFGSFDGEKMVSSRRVSTERRCTSDEYGIHVFLHENFYAAVYATNILMRVSDVMITKPSELSFYPVPKLFIQRVGIGL